MEIELTDEPAFTSDPEEIEEEPAEEAQPEDGNAEEPASESPPEQEEVDKPLPFHKHPKWIRANRENQELRSMLEETKGLLEQMAQQKKANEPVTVPEEYQNVFGDDVDAFQKMVLLARKEAQEAALKTIETRELSQREAQQKEQQEQAKFLEWANQEFEELSSDAGVDLTKSDNPIRNKMLDLVEENNLYTADGNPNLRAALKLHKLLHSEDQDVVKKGRQSIAGNSSAPKTNASGVSKGPKTPSMLKKMSLDQFFN